MPGDLSTSPAAYQIDGSSATYNIASADFTPSTGCTISSYTFHTAQSTTSSTNSLYSLTWDGTNVVVTNADPSSYSTVGTDTLYILLTFSDGETAWAFVGTDYAFGFAKNGCSVTMPSSGLNA